MAYKAGSKGWIEVLSTNDAEALWAKMFAVISKHSAVRTMYTSTRAAGEGLRDIHYDLTQELFLRLHQKNRWRHYLKEKYTDEQVEQELYRIEVPNLISRLQRERYPESYRIARRISDLLQNRPEFRRHSLMVDPSNGVKRRDCNKMALRLYGLSCWSEDKPVKPQSGLEQAIKDVPFRLRDTRTTGRGSGSQVIISNEELKRLMVDILIAIDTPTSVRAMRSLVMSKLTIEDCRMVSIDAAPEAFDAEQSAFKVDLPDDRPSPLDALFEKERRYQIDMLAADLLDQMKKSVRHRQQRFRKLIEIAWHCYFDLSSPSQSSIANRMGISDSLVSHYRRIFDSHVKGLPALSMDEWIVLNGVLAKRLGDMMSDFNESSPAAKTIIPDRTPHGWSSYTRAAAASKPN